MSGNIDWSQLVTQAMKDQAATALHIAALVSQTLARRAVADAAIAPLQDAVDIDDAAENDLVRLKAWKRYRVALMRLPQQAGYPVVVEWPALPA